MINLNTSYTQFLKPLFAQKCVKQKIKIPYFMIYNILISLEISKTFIVCSLKKIYNITYFIIKNVSMFIVYLSLPRNK